MNNIKELMDRRGMQQKELAALCHVSGPTVSDWCNGKKNPSGKNLMRLTEIFETTSGVILGYDPVRPSHVNSDPWDLGELDRADREDETLSILQRGIYKMSHENRQKLLDVARTFFREDFDEQGNKR